MVRKSAKSSVQNKEDQNGAHLSPFKLAKLLDPEASWDKVCVCLFVFFI